MEEVAAGCMGGSAGRKEGKKGQAEGWRSETCRVW